MGAWLCLTVDVLEDGFEYDLLRVLLAVLLTGRVFTFCRIPLGLTYLLLLLTGFACLVLTFCFLFVDPFCGAVALF